VLSDMPAPLRPEAPPLRFGRFELHPKERRLLVDGEPAHLGGRAFDLLATLADQPDRLVGKNELIDKVWPGLIVEESNLHTQMSALRKVLGGDVVVTVPGRGYRFVAKTDSPAATPAPPAPAAPVPPGALLPVAAGPLVGRVADLGRVEQALRAGGCVTLARPGGVGKTRLALAAAERWKARRCWIDLAPLGDGVQVAGALARALGMPLSDGDAGPQLARALAGEPVLVVLDNAEHLLDAVAALATELLAALPQLVLLVTSQIALAVGAERVLRIEPLAIETGAAAGAQAASGALALLADRIAAADPRVRIDAAAWPLMREICEQLDGLPLALEMAAARVPLLGLKGVRDKLAHRFALLTTGRRLAAPRQRTLHAALDWSFGLARPAATAPVCRARRVCRRLYPRSVRGAGGR
jgi:DNA-binding winged helix-turn-helix (wHTH) protein